MSKEYFVEERRKKIIDILHKQKRVKVRELSEMFSVSEDLIRKDFNVLEKQNILKRTYGGAILNTKMSELTPFSKRIQALEENIHLSKLAADYVENGDTIFIEASSFTYPILELIKDKEDLTIVTNGFHGLVDLLPAAKVIHTGGFIHKQDEAAYGFITNEAIKQIYYDKCFLSLVGVTKDFMMTAGIEDGVSLKKCAMDNSKEVVVLISWNKWDHHGIYKVCGIDHIDVIISDTNDGDILKYLKENNIKLLSPEIETLG
jgi:DeoR/GlpR family transcriptional regulator of sugar metabolism